MKKGPIKKITINLNSIKLVVITILCSLIMLVILFLPLSDFVSDDNKSYLGSLIGSGVAVIGAVSAALVTVKMNKKHEEQKSFPIKYAKLKELILDSRKYFISLETLTFNKDTLDDPDKYMSNKLEEFIVYYHQTLNDVIYIDTETSLKFIDSFKDELDLANALLNHANISGKIQMYSYISSLYYMFQTEEAKKVISTGEKIDEKDSDDTQYRIIDGKILISIYIPYIEKKVSVFISDLNQLDKKMRGKVYSPHQ